MTANSSLFVFFAAAAALGTVPQARATGQDLPPAMIVPFASAPADEALVVRALTAIPPAGVLELWWRVRDGEEQSVPFHRVSAESWEARIPGESVVPPTIAVRVVERNDKEERELMGSRKRPVIVTVVLEGKSLEQAERLREAGGRRSEASATVNALSFGTSPEGARDGFVQAEIGFRYRLLSTVSAIRLGGGTIRGSAAVSCFGARCDEPVVTRDVGYDYGFGELTFGGGLFEVDLRGNLGANQYGFRLGAAVTARVGASNGSHMELGFTAIDGVGASGRALLHWDTVPSFPMAAGVEVTSMPAGGDAAVRLIAKVEWRVSDDFSVGVDGGYQARSSLLGGAGIGGRLALRF